MIDAIAVGVFVTVGGTIILGMCFSLLCMFLEDLGLEHLAKPLVIVIALAVIVGGVAGYASYLMH
jgi:hypothetical protein